MKNSKREITLNEYDSLEDMLFMEKSLLREYCTAIFSAQRKETRSYLLQAFSAVAEDIFFIEDLLAARQGEKGKN